MCVFCVPQNVHILPTQNPPPHRGTISLKPAPHHKSHIHNGSNLTILPIHSPWGACDKLVSFSLDSERKMLSLIRLDQLVSVGLDKKKHPLTILKLQSFFVIVVFSPQFLHQSCHAPHPTATLPPPIPFPRSHGCHPTNAGGFGLIHQGTRSPSKQPSPKNWSISLVSSCGTAAVMGPHPPQCHPPPLPENKAGRP